MGVKKSVALYLGLLLLIQCTVTGADNNSNDFSKALLSNEIIIINIVTIFISILVVYYYARLKKSAELTEINNNFNTLLEQQKVLTRETEAINQSLDKDSIHYQIKLSAYQEKSIQAIENVYKALIQLRDSAKEFGLNPNDEEGRKLLQALKEFRSIFELKKIWLPVILSKQIATVAIKIDNRSQMFMFAINREKNHYKLSPKQEEKNFNEQDNFYDFLNKEINVIIDDLVEKITIEVNT